MFVTGSARLSICLPDGRPSIHAVHMDSLGKVGQTLRPGQHGTQRHLRRFGDRLLLVCYRYDPARQVRRTTVELLVEESPWVPPAPKTVHVHVAWTETDLRQRLKGAGARWNSLVRRWETTQDVARALGLENRIDLPSAGL